MKAEYRKIAERRVRLGLVIGEIGDKAKVQVGQDELRRALIEQARRYPGQEKVVYEYYEKNPSALIELRAPIFEDKVVELHPRAGQARREEGERRGAAEAATRMSRRTCTTVRRRPRSWARP